MSHHLLSVAPVLLGNAVRPPLTLLTAVIGLGGLALGAWLAWIGVFFDRPTGTPVAGSARPTAPTSTEPRSDPDPDRTKAVV